MTILGIMSLLVVAIAHAAPPDARHATPFKYAVVVFDHQANRVVCEGRISARQFQKWFKEDYAVAGERIETPKDATACGALTLSDGNEILVMPLYRWGSGKVRQFACQSHEIGRAPMFSVVEEAEPVFFQTIRNRLVELSKAEPRVPATGVSPRR